MGARLFKTLWAHICGLPDSAKDIERQIKKGLAMGFGERKYKGYTTWNSMDYDIDEENYKKRKRCGK